jgi:glucose-6-phosphate isomerase
MSTILPDSTKPTFVDWSSGAISGEAIEESLKTLGQLPCLFHDEAAWRSMDPETEVYRVRFWRPVPDGTSGGLFWGATILQPTGISTPFAIGQNSTPP